MHIIKIDSEELLNSFVGAETHSRFLQSWEWGEFLKTGNTPIFRLGVEENGKIVAAATIVENKLLGKINYLYCPGGPVIKEKGVNEKDVLNFLLSEIRGWIGGPPAIFLRFEPRADFNLPNGSSGKAQDVRKTIDIQPSKTSILDTDQAEEELLKNMRPKTRYNIRLAEKRGVKVRAGKVSDFGQFWELISATVKRDGFRSHAKNHYRLLLNVDSVRLYVAEYRGKIIAANIVSFFGDTATYLHGGSGNENRNVMAPYLLQWFSIKTARAAGYRYYDFNGADYERWPGVTRFKLGFGGKSFVYPGTFDLVYSPGWYAIYKLARKFRRSF